MSLSTSPSFVFSIKSSCSNNKIILQDGVIKNLRYLSCQTAHWEIKSKLERDKFSEILIHFLHWKAENGRIILEHIWLFCG